MASPSQSAYVESRWIARRHRAAHDQGVLIKCDGGGSYSAGAGHWESHTTTTTHEYTPLEASSSGVAQDPTLQRNGQIYTTTSTNTNTYVPGTRTYSGPTVSYIPKTENCRQAALGAQGKAGLRMRGTYVGADGFSVEFYPDSAVMGCGRAARAYPYMVKAMLADGYQDRRP
jgi:hypothetical protein